MNIVTSGSQGGTGGHRQIFPGIDVVAVRANADFRGQKGIGLLQRNFGELGDLVYHDGSFEWLGWV
jgi:hypothetical protein